MKFKRILTAVLAVLMLATCMSFTAGAATTPATVYVNDSAGPGGNGSSPETAFDTFDEAWTAVATAGGKIVLVGDTAFDKPGSKVNGDVLITSAEGEKYGLYIPKTGSVQFSAGSVNGELRFENVNIFGSTNGNKVYFFADAGPTTLVIGEGVTFLKDDVANGIRRTLFHAGSVNKFGGHVTVVEGGEGGYIYTGPGGNGGYSGGKPVYLRYLGGSHDVNFGFAQASADPNNRLVGVSLLFDAEPLSLASTNINRRGGSYLQAIYNNNVPDLIKKYNLDHSGGAGDFALSAVYAILSGEGGRVDYILGSDGYPKRGEYKAYTDRDYVYVDGVKYEVSNGEVTFTVDGASSFANYKNNGNGVHTVTYEYEPIDLTFYAAEGDAEAFATVTVSDKKVAFPATNPEKPGYTFDGWKTLDGAAVNEGDAVDADTSYYAMWRTPDVNESSVVTILFNKLTVKFDTDGGSEVAPQYVTLGSKVTKPALDPVKPGYVFDGWYSSTDFYKRFSFQNTKITANTTIYAKWVKSDDVTKRIILTVDNHEANVFGKLITNDVAPIIRNDRTMLPARFIAENLGATVEWTEWQRKVVITSADKKTIITIFIDSATAYINGVAYTLDAPAFIENDRTYTPVRFVAEALGATVEWKEGDREVIIYKK